MASNRLKSERFRDQVKAFFMLNLIRVVPRIPFDKISVHLRENTRPTASHLLLGDHFGVTVSTTYPLDISGALNRAKENAERDGRAYGAAVVQRHRHSDAASQYVILDLETFAQLVQKVERRS